MNSADLFQDFSSLPEDLQKRVAAFIAALKQKAEMPHRPRKHRRKPGAFEGQVKMAPDFDEPLEDFKEYMG